MKHVAVVGSGIAGLIVALELSRKYRVTLVTKASLADSNTRWAQGGIAAVMFPDDSVAEHVADTLSAGAGLCDPRAVEVLCAEGPARIHDLIGLGVGFDLREGELARGLEAAHSRPRVLHAGGDATGLRIELALVEAVRAADISIREHTFACDLVLDRDVGLDRDLVLEAARVRGLEVLDAQGQKQTLACDAVVLASGGAGQLYRYTTNPAVATGDGVALALRAGAQVENVEFYQFHPTALAVPGTFLISEAVRGEGAVLLDANGNRFMQQVHPQAELAPRDVVARGIAQQMAMQANQPVLLDATALGERFLRARFPSIDAACRDLGLDWAHRPIPVTPAAHYWMGGVRSDLWGRTSIRGLYAVGEVACTGVHGANRLASNSLLESLVFAWRCGQRLLESDVLNDEAAAFAAGGSQGAELLLTDLGPAANASLVDREALQALMWSSVGIARNAEGLHDAAAQLQRWRGGVNGVWAREDGNLLTLARVMVAAATAREESRGAHFRTDFPQPLASFAHALCYETTPMQEAKFMKQEASAAC